MMGETKEEDEENDFDYQYELEHERKKRKKRNKSVISKYDDDMIHVDSPNSMASSTTTTLNNRRVGRRPSPMSSSSFSRQECGGETKEASLHCASDQHYAYVQALAQHHLQIKKCRGDGNCFFRTVSHQVYGTEVHHQLVRSACCDYMQANSMHFSVVAAGPATTAGSNAAAAAVPPPAVPPAPLPPPPPLSISALTYVAAPPLPPPTPPTTSTPPPPTTSSPPPPSLPFPPSSNFSSPFEQYLLAMRTDGTYGGHPELCAVSEMYRRPIEIWAFDPSIGARRVPCHLGGMFTNNPMRVSYFLGGHYDSIISNIMDMGGGGGGGSGGGAAGAGAGAGGGGGGGKKQQEEMIPGVLEASAIAFAKARLEWSRVHDDHF